MKISKFMLENFDDSEEWWKPKKGDTLVGGCGCGFLILIFIAMIASQCDSKNDGFYGGGL